MTPRDPRLDGRDGGRGGPPDLWSPAVQGAAPVTRPSPRGRPIPPRPSRGDAATEFIPAVDDPAQQRRRDEPRPGRGRYQTTTGRTAAVGVGPEASAAVSAPPVDGPVRRPDVASSAGRIGLSSGPILSGNHQIRTGRRADPHGKLPEVRRMRAATVILAVLVLLGGPLGYSAFREATKDPVLADLAGLKVPGWAAMEPKNHATGNSWCVHECRFRQRTLRAERPQDETHAVYAQALTAAGWQPWRVTGCPPEGVVGVESCWHRDQYILDLWTYQAECEVQLKAPDPSPGTRGGPLAEAVCPPTVVELKVINRVAWKAPTADGA